MLEVHLYGKLRELVPGSRPDEDTIMMCEYREGEDFMSFVNRLGIAASELGDCFVNGNLAWPADVLKDGDRIGLFPFNMVLIDGGMMIKYHPHRDR